MVGMKHPKPETINKGEWVNLHIISCAEILLRHLTPYSNPSSQESMYLWGYQGQRLSRLRLWFLHWSHVVSNWQNSYNLPRILLSLTSTLRKSNEFGFIGIGSKGDRGMDEDQANLSSKLRKCVWEIRIKVHLTRPVNHRVWTVDVIFTLLIWPLPDAAKSPHSWSCVHLQRAWPSVWIFIPTVHIIKTVQLHDINGPCIISTADNIVYRAECAAR